MSESSTKHTIERKLFTFRTRKCVPCDGIYLPVPRGRSGHRIIADEANMYTFGGFNPVLDADEEIPSVANAVYSRLFDEIWRYNFASKEWDLLDIAKDSFPNQLASPIVEMVGSNMIIHGGTGLPFGVMNSNCTYAVKINTDERLKLLQTNGVTPDPMYGQASFVDKEQMKLYLVGGTSGMEFFMDVYCLDLKSLTWSLLGNVSIDKPPARYRHEIALYENKIIVFGGGTIDRAFDFQDLPAFNLQTYRWESIWTKGYRISGAQAKFPPGRRSHGGVLVPAEEGRDAEYIICGGFNGRRVFSDIWSLNLRTMQWTKWLSHLPTPLYFHACALTPQGLLCTFGGIRSGERNNDFSVRTNQVVTCWVKIPKLSEIAWEAVLHYVPNVQRYPTTKLLNIGIPKRFLDRISRSS